MVRVVLAAILLAGIIIIDPASAQERQKGKPGGRKGPEMAFRLADENRDGKLSRTELEKLVGRGPAKGKADPKQLFDRLDANKDGFISAEEFRRIQDVRGAFGKGDKAKSKEGRPIEQSGFNDRPTAEQSAFFEKKIRPVLVDQCYSCHSAEAKKQKGGLRLDTAEALRAGGANGAAIVPGDPNHSLLVKAIRHQEEDLKMPPKKKLADDVIGDFEKWVKMGAPDPRGATTTATTIDIEKGRTFWAFQPPKHVATATVTNASWAKTDVDRFVLAALEAKGLTPVADAEERTLLRRVYLDIIGLPPTGEEVEAYVFDRDPQKLANTVDKLLASPHFGERWGRHWLDVARYAESTGKSVNYNYPHAWRYRDYVIAAYNADKPFDLFAKEQLAGDLLPAADERDRTENMIATGFLAIGTKSLNERNRLQFELDLADEQIDTFSQAFLGITVACARCHDHKFDPIPMTDYYALAGIFRSTETCYGTINAIQSRYASPLLQIPDEVDAPAGMAPLSQRERDDLNRQLKRFKGELEEMEKSKGVRETFLAANGVRNRIQIAMLEAKLSLYQENGQPKKQAMGVREKSRARDSVVYQRGEPDKPADVVRRGTLQVCSLQPLDIQSGSGRKELADWVASKDNPLTARVYVNRVWLHLFGRGLVATPDNFGSSGQLPSNPALLDHLATWFVDHGWSTKQLVKHLVLSHAYQLSTRFDAKNFEADPDNTLNWRMSPGRLDAETIRDAMLAVGGNLDRKAQAGSSVSRGGEGYSAQMLRPGPFAAASANDSLHRSIYLPMIRDNIPESLALFDAPDPSFVNGDRMNTTVPAQALFLMNNPFVIQQAETAAKRLLTGSGSETERVRQAYLLFLGRPPQENEIKRAGEFLESYGRRATERQSWAAFCQALFGSAEFLLRQ